MILGEPLAAEPQLEPDVGRADDGFHVERAHVELLALDEEDLLLFPLHRHLAVVDAGQVALDDAELSYPSCFPRVSEEITSTWYYLRVGWAK